MPTGYPAREPDGDDLVFLYTGGTTGMPKGVMWRNGRHLPRDLGVHASAAARSRRTRGPRHEPESVPQRCCRPRR